MYKGFYWSVDANNLLSNDKKQSYGQAFCIYALCAYYEYSNNEKAINLAYETFLVVEKNTKDFKLGGYVEGFFRNWTTLPDMRLGVDDLNASKTMNNHLHLLEAYTALYKVSKKEAVQKALMKLLYLYTTRFVNSATGNTILFCDKEWTVQANIISPGHDIESAWLLYEALEVLGLEKSSIETVQLIKKMMDEIYQNWINEDGAILNENHNGKQDLSFDWWQQAEAVVGFFYAYQLFKEEHYLNQALKTWNFIQQYFKNTSKGEWFWKIDQHYQPDLKKPKSGAWKSPYHNGRMCLEILEKMNV